MTSLNEERVVWHDTFYVETFDFRSRIHFDECTFVRCTILIDDGTEQLAFTKCTFKDCNIDHVGPDDERGIVSNGNTFDRPLEEKRREFDERLATLLKGSTRYEASGLGPFGSVHAFKRLSLFGTSCLSGGLSTGLVYEKGTVRLWL